MRRAVVDAKEFSHAMSKVSKILKKSAIPILEEVCLRIQNGRCTLTATDLETWLTAEFPASGDDMFFAFRKTKDILRACSHFAGELTMEFSETQSGSKKAGRVLLRCERRGAEFEVYDGADYARTYACLSAYLPTIDIWNEYKNQNPETLEKPWNTLRKLYQDSNPDISDLTAAIPYTVFPSGLLCHHGRNISFCHDNYRDFFAAFHIANVVYGLCNGINLAALSPDAQEVFLLQLETLDNSILFDAISILRQYFGLSIYDISAQDTTDLSDTCAQIALPAMEEGGKGEGV